MRRVNDVQDPVRFLLCDMTNQGGDAARDKPVKSMAFFMAAVTVRIREAVGAVWHDAYQGGTPVDTK